MKCDNRHELLCRFFECSLSTAWISRSTESLTYMVKVDNLYKIQVGAFSKKANADAMAAKLKAAGFDTYITTKSGTAVSASSAKKSTDQIAREVIQGLWGNGVDRTNRLKAAGYDPSVIQNRVNQLLK